MVDDSIRSFIAIRLPEQLLDRVRDFQAALGSPGDRAAKWVEPGSMHITLKFLGNIELGRVQDIKQEIAAAVKPCRPFNLSTGASGFFPNAQRARVFWLGLEGDIQALVGLHKGIDEAMAKLGYPAENRPYTAHLTLARLREESGAADRTGFVSRVQKRAFGPSCNIVVNSVALMRSQLTPRGPIYTRLAEFELPGREGP